ISNETIRPPTSAVRLRSPLKKYQQMHASTAPASSDQVTILPATRSLAANTSSSSGGGSNRRVRFAPSTFSSSWATNNHSTQKLKCWSGEKHKGRKRERN